jgi:hypothetical protein
LYSFARFYFFKRNCKNRFNSPDFKSYETATNTIKPEDIEVGTEINKFSEILHTFQAVMPVITDANRAFKDENDICLRPSLPMRFLRYAASKIKLKQDAAAVAKANPPPPHRTH